MLMLLYYNSIALGQSGLQMPLYLVLIGISIFSLKSVKIFTADQICQPIFIRQLWKTVENT